MDTTYILHGIQFEWDAHKATINKRKHRVSFETACEVFFDPFIFPVEDESDTSEERQTVIGLSENWALLYVVYVERDPKIRLISARSTTGRERSLYENQ